MPLGKITRLMLIAVVGWLTTAATPLPLDPNLAAGSATIRGLAGASEIVITTTPRLAGAIDSLRWGGKEFIDSHDHGRQLQSACSFDDGSSPFWPEAFNPTEAGSRADGTGERSSSRLLNLRAEGRELRSTTQMAFWLAPGERSNGFHAKNDQILSDYLLAKRVRIGYPGWPHAIDYEVTFSIPAQAKHTYAQFEALTGYMPAEFSRFLRYNLASGELEALDDGPGEQEFPVVFTTPSGSHAMAIYSPDQPSKGYEKAGYGRWRFKSQQVVKWNCVFRLRDPRGVATGRYPFHMFVIVGSLEEVKTTLAGLSAAFRRP